MIKIGDIVTVRVPTKMDLVEPSKGSWLRASQELQAGGADWISMEVTPGMRLTVIDLQGVDVIVQQMNASDDEWALQDCYIELWEGLR